MTRTKQDTAPDPVTMESVDPELYRFGADGAVTIFGSRSDALGTLFWPPRLRCPITGGTVSEVSLANTGSVWTWTFVHTPWGGDVSPSGGSNGYAAGLVDLDHDGPRVIAVFLVGEGGVVVGDRVRATALPVAEGPDGQRCLLAFAVLRDGRPS